jgi:hypothetical protein
LGFNVFYHEEDIMLNGTFYRRFILSFFILTPISHAEEEKSILNTLVETSISTNAAGAGSSKNESVVMQEYIFMFDLSKGWDLWIYAGLDKRIEGPTYDGGVNDSFIQLRKILYQNEIFRFALAGRYFIPLSENSRDNTQLKWAYQIRPELRTTFYKNGEMNFWVLSWLYYTENFYSSEYRLSDGMYNLKSNLSFDHYLRLQITDLFYFGFFGRIRTHWNTAGERVDDRWFFAQSIGFQLNKIYYLEFWHERGDRLYSQGGRSMSVDIYNAKDSTFKLLVGAFF